MCFKEAETLHTESDHIKTIVLLAYPHASIFGSTQLWDRGCCGSWVFIPNTVFGYLSTFRIYNDEFTFYEVKEKEEKPETNWM